MATNRLAKRVPHSFCTLILLCVGATASAKVLRWQLQDVEFNDGRTVNGFFLFDADAKPDTFPLGSHDQRFVDWDISVEGQSNCSSGLCFPAYRFTPDTSTKGLIYSGAPFFLFSNKPFYDPLGRNYIELQLAFSSPLTDAGGAVALQTGVSFEDWSYYYRTQFIAAGRVIAVPEPSKALLFTLGLVGLAANSRGRYRRLRAKKTLFLERLSHAECDHPDQIAAP